jgi:uncharacterized membrane protein
MEVVMTETQTWTGAERRTGRERRTDHQPRPDERRRGDRRRGGVGTSRPEPTEALLKGIPREDEIEFVPRPVDDAPRGDAPVALEPLSEGQAGMDADDLKRTPVAVPSVAHIGGHPIHPMIVPLPIGALTLALASDLAYVLTDDPFFARASRVLTAAGLVTGGAAAVFGAADFLGRERTRSYTSAWVHAGGNVLAMALSGASLALRVRDERSAVVPAGMTLSLLTGGILAVTGWIGGELTYRHRIGVLPEDRA